MLRHPTIDAHPIAKLRDNQILEEIGLIIQP